MREVTFREAGGGTGLDCDLDEFNLAKSVMSNLSFGIPRTKKLLRVPDLSVAAMQEKMPMADISALRLSFLTSLRSSSMNICLTR